MYKLFKWLQIKKYQKINNQKAAASQKFQEIPYHLTA
jgi:hypothetical protein